MGLRHFEMFLDLTAIRYLSNWSLLNLLLMKDKPRLDLLKRNSRAQFTSKRFVTQQTKISNTICMTESFSELSATLPFKPFLGIQCRTHAMHCEEQRCNLNERIIRLIAASSSSVSWYTGDETRRKRMFSRRLTKRLITHEVTLFLLLGRRLSWANRLSAIIAAELVTRRNNFHSESGRSFPVEFLHLHLMLNF